MSESQMLSAIQTRLSAHIDNDADLRSTSRTISDIALGREVSDRALSKVVGNKYALNALNDVIGAKLRQGATFSDVKAAIKSYQESSSAKSGADMTGKAQSGSKAKISGRSGVNFSMSKAQDGGFDVTASSGSNIETIRHFDSQRQAEAAVYAMTLEIGPDGTRGFISMAENIDGVDIGNAAIVYNAIYNQGRSGKAFSAVKNMNLLSPEQRQLAYRYGVMDRVAGDLKAKKTSGKGLQKDGKNDTIETTQSRRENSDGKESGKEELGRSDRRTEGGTTEKQSRTRTQNGDGFRVQGDDRGKRRQERGQCEQIDLLYTCRRDYGPEQT